MKDRILRLFKYGISGVINNVVYYIVYYAVLLINSSIYMIANIIGYCVSVFSAYLLNSRFVFKDKTNAKKNFFKTFLSYFFSLLISSYLLWLFVEKFNISELIAPLLSLFITVPMNYLINKLWIYKK